MTTPPVEEIILECAEEEDNMSYPYPKFQNKQDVEAHIRAFLQTREAKHIFQRLTESEAKPSKIAEFELRWKNQRRDGTHKANHISQRPTEFEAKQSKIAEFELSLEGPTARWHTQHSPGSFTTFNDLRDTLLPLFHR